MIPRTSKSGRPAFVRSGDCAPCAGHSVDCASSSKVSERVGRHGPPLQARNAPPGPFIPQKRAVNGTLNDGAKMPQAPAFGGFAGSGLPKREEERPRSDEEE